MAGNKQGGMRARDKNYMFYGQDFYARIGSMGGKKSRGGGFTDRELAARAGAIGGRKSRRRTKRVLA